MKFAVYILAMKNQNSHMHTLFKKGFTVADPEALKWNTPFNRNEKYRGVASPLVAHAESHIASISPCVGI